MNIRDTFLKLTSKTYPYGTERQLLSFLPRGLKQDLWGNYFYEIGQSKTIFACHLDTANKEQGIVRHVFDGDYIKTDGTSILGADDKAGVTILLWLIEHKIPGTYYFFIGEEVGCIGSSAASKDIDRFSKFDRILSFDRRDTQSVITHQSWVRCCSDKFADALIEQIENGGLCFKKDDGGVYTDSAEFTDVIPECTNLSVGYYNEHTHNEKQDINFLIALCNSLLVVDWENLPTVRNPKDTEYKDYHSTYGVEYAEWDVSGWNKSKSLGQAYMEEYDLDYKRKKKRYDDDYEIDRQFGLDDDDDFDPFDNDDFLVSGSKFLKEEYRSLQDTRKSFQYGILKELYFDDVLSEEEIEIIKQQYLDMNDPSDVDFVEHLNKQ